MMSKDERVGWDWLAFILGPIWYFTKGMIGKGIFLSLICLFTIGLGAPFIWIYCGARGKGDYYEFRLKQKNKFDLNRL
ncbi:MAG TPA: hypothetical protein PLR60_13700 [Syntrophorhabdaceae bacterium]|nr:hypothetical protein [Syntrophorhabdaceae bacterium]